MMTLALVCAMSLLSPSSKIAINSNSQPRLEVVGKQAKIVGMPGLVDTTDLAANKVNYKFGGRELKRQLDVILELEGAKPISGIGAFGQLMRVSPSKYVLFWFIEREEAAAGGGGDSARPLPDWIMGKCNSDTRKRVSRDKL